MKTARQLSAFVLLIAGSIAIYGGIHLILDPTGNSLGFPFYLLNGTIFPDYLLTGWILLLTVGVSSVLITICVLQKLSWYSFLVMVQGAVICVYVFIMMLLLGETFPIEWVYLILGIALIGLGVLQNQRRLIVEAQRRSKVQPKQKRK
ncbi:MAG: hypothetical protein JO301_00550 [Chitinophagaceae bacterium]|nr:hypothetical protein [Chitinophagaceae bacterium]